MASATLTEDVISLKKSVLHHAVILKLEEPNLPPLTQLTHFYVNAEEEEKAVILYTLLKLSLFTGKSIIFVNTVDRCYKYVLYYLFLLVISQNLFHKYMFRLKLFLEQFGISTCVLNSELPAASRCHSVSQFNEDVYKIIIASDERALEEDFGNSANKRYGSINLILLIL